MEAHASPDFGIDWLKFYRENLISYLKGSNHEIIKANAKSFLKNIDSVLEAYQEFPEIDFAEICTDSELINVTKSEISQNLLEFISDNFGELEIESEEGIRAYGNTIKDFRRVVNRALDNEPLYLIKGQFRFFKEFIERLSSPPKTIFDF